MKKQLLQWLSLLIVSYVAGLLSWFALWSLPGGDRFWWLTVLNSQPAYLFVPAPLPFFFALVQRSRTLLVLALAPPLIWVTIFWPYYLPRWTNAPGAPDLRVMTYNVLYSNPDDGAVAQFIRAYQPDLVALQEVQPAMMAALQRRLVSDYPHSHLGTAHPYGTTAILSRYPLVRVAVVDLAVDRPAVVVQVQIQERPVTFVAAHLTAYGWQWVPYPQLPALIRQRTQEQNRQAQILLDNILTADPKPIIILGCDCNSKETGSSYRLLSGPLTNAARAVGWQLGVTLPPNTFADRELMHIDYLFFRGPLLVNQLYKVGESGGSDHLPVVGEFSFMD